jgi:alpha,alpha-trehalase
VTIVIDRARFDAVVFDLDGVVTDTASVHRAAWKHLFDEFLETITGAGRIEPFSEDDYRRYVDGRPRYDGVVAFLGSRGIDLPYGAADDPVEARTVCGLGNRKDSYFHELVAARGVEAFATTVTLVRRLQRAGIGTAVYSASRNCGEVLAAAGLGDLFPVRIDGVEAERLGLAGKPDPAVPLEAVRRLATAPDRAVLVEDAQAGVEAGRRGGFGLVIGVDRGGNRGALLERGADVVVTDLAEVGVVHPGSSAA